MDFVDKFSITTGIISIVIGIPSLVFSILSYNMVRYVRKAVNAATSRAIVRTGHPDATLKLTFAIERILQAENAVECQAVLISIVDLILGVIYSDFATDEIKETFQEIMQLNQQISKGVERCDLYTFKTKGISLLIQIQNQLQMEG